MKGLFIVALCLFGMGSYAQEYKVITTIESIVPMGIGRSRIVENTEVMESEAFTTQRTAGKDGDKQRGVKRKDAKIENFKETKMLNFYSGVGINFQNIASNDALITDKINDLTKEGWELTFVTSGVESKGAKDDNQGIFITRYIFKRN
jgi:hypothetical protein